MTVRITNLRQDGTPKTSKSSDVITNLSNHYGCTVVSNTPNDIVIGNWNGSLEDFLGAVVSEGLTYSEAGISP